MPIAIQFTLNFNLPLHFGFQFTPQWDFNLPSDESEISIYLRREWDFNLPWHSQEIFSSWLKGKLKYYLLVSIYLSWWYFNLLFDPHCGRKVNWNLVMSKVNWNVSIEISSWPKGKLKSQHGWKGKLESQHSRKVNWNLSIVER